MIGVGDVKMSNELPFIINLKDCQRKNIFEDVLKKYGLGVFYNELGMQLFHLDTGKILDAEKEFNPKPTILNTTSESYEIKH